MSHPEQHGDSFLPGVATTSARPVGGLMGLVLRRRGGRQAVQGLIGLLCVSAVGVFAFPAVTDILGAQRQRHVQFNPNDPQFKTEWAKGGIRVGQGLTRLEIDNDRVKVNVVVVEGTSVAALQAGAGHYPETPYPCARGNVAIAGHRTTYGRPFNRLDQMRPGDTVTLITPIGACQYQVVKPFAPYSKNPFIVSPDDVSVVGQTGKLATGHWLTLTSCNPPGSASERIVLRLKMIHSTVKVAPTNTTSGSGPSSVEGGD
jgi:sortase A